MNYISQLAALAHPHRLRVFRYLVSHGGNDLPVGKIGIELSISASSLSGYLSTLERSELLISRRESRFIYYQINKVAVKNLMTYLVSDCCGAQPQLCGMVAPPILKDKPESPTLNKH